VLGDGTPSTLNEIKACYFNVDNLAIELKIPTLVNNDEVPR